MIKLFFLMIKKFVKFSYVEALDGVHKWRKKNTTNDTKNLTESFVNHTNCVMDKKKWKFDCELIALVDESHAISSSWVTWLTEFIEWMKMISMINQNDSLENNFCKNDAISHHLRYLK